MTLSNTMFLGVVVFLVALATNDVNAQNYDIADCSQTYIAPETHHAENPDDCRTFYNCDNANGGKLTNCAPGTLYDRESGRCVSGGVCPKWDSVFCAGNPNAVGKFSGLCCDIYFQYDCQSRTSSFHYCATGSFFVPEPNRPGFGACSNVRPAGCSDCNSSGQTGCGVTNLQYVDNCHFKVKGWPEPIKCPPGTAMNPEKCMCDHDNSFSCTDPEPQPGCQNKRVFNFNENAFQLASQVDQNSADFRTTFPGGQCADVWNLKYQDITYIPFSILLRFRLTQQVTGNVKILSSEQSCGKTKLEVTVVNGNTVRVTLAARNQVVALQNIVNFGSEVTVKVAFNLAGRQLTATANGLGLNPDANLPAILNDWAQAGIEVLCLPMLCPFSGTVTQFAFWRTCTDMQLIN